MTKYELEIIKSLKILGFNYLTRDKAGNLWAHKKNPELYESLWSSDFGDMLMSESIAKDEFKFLKGFSKKPFDIHYIDNPDKKYVNVKAVKGAEGFSLQVYNDKNSGYRVFGPKAWGNPYNRSHIRFENVEVDELIEAILWNQYELKDDV